VTASTPAAPFVHAIRLRADGGDDYPADLPALRCLERLELDPCTTFFVGENGSGKSTLVEAIPVAAKLNAEGGGRTQQFSFSTRASHSSLHRRLELERATLPPLNAFFLRAESVFNLATAVEGAGMENVFQQPLHEQSHGESFLDIAVSP
jgi:predicted ATPase